MPLSRDASDAAPVTPGARRGRACERAHLRGGEIDVRDLPDRVHADIGATGDRRGAARAAAAEDRGERLLELPLHGALVRAGAPSPRTPCRRTRCRGGCAPNRARRFPRAESRLGRGIADEAPDPAPRPRPRNPVAPSTPFRVTGLDGVRAIAVLLVIVFHLSPGCRRRRLHRRRPVLRGQRLPDHVAAAARARAARAHRARRVLAPPRPAAAARARRAAAGVLHRRLRRSAATCWSASAAGARRGDLQQQLAVPGGVVGLLRLDRARAVPQPVVARRRGAVLPALAAAARARAAARAALGAHRRGAAARRRLGGLDGGARGPPTTPPASTTAPTPTSSDSRSARRWRSPPCTGRPRRSSGRDGSAPRWEWPGRSRWPASWPSRRDARGCRDHLPGRARARRRC